MKTPAERLSCILRDLTHPDPRVRSSAVTELRWTDARRSPELLTATLLPLASDPAIRVRRATYWEYLTFVGFCYHLRSDAASNLLPPLAKGLSDEDYKVRCHAAEALAEIDPPVLNFAAAELQKACKDAHPCVRSSAESASSKMVIASIHGDTTDAGQLERMLHDANPMVRKSAAALAWDAARSSRDEPVPRILSEALVEALRDPDLGVRREACSSLHTFIMNDMKVLNLDEVIRSFSSILGDGDVRLSAAVALADIGAAVKDVMPLLEILLADGNPFVRVSAAGALVAEPLNADGPTRQEAIGTLLELLTVPQLGVCWDASIILHREPLLLGDRVEHVIAALGNASPEVRACAAWVLVAMGPQAAPAVPVLARLVKDPDADVSCRAAWALAEIGPAAEASVPVLLGAVAHPDSHTRGNAISALEKIGVFNETVVSTLIDALEDPYWLVRLRAVESLGKIGPRAKRAVKALQPFLQDEDTETDAAEALRSITG